MIGDTAPAAERVRLEAIRRLDPERRVREALALSETMRRLAVMRLASRFPRRTELELVETMLGEMLVPPADRPQHR